MRMAGLEAATFRMVGQLSASEGRRGRYATPWARERPHGHAWRLTSGQPFGRHRPLTEGARIAKTSRRGDRHADGRSGRKRNVEDVRGMGGGGGGGFGFGGRGIGLGSIAIALVAGWIFGINPLDPARHAERRRRPGRAAGAGPGAEAAGRRRRRALRLAGAAQHRGRLDRRVHASRASTYQPPKLVLFSGSCPTGLRPGPGGDGAVLLPGRPARSTSTWASTRCMSQQLGAPGEFAQAYVIAHEVGHHVQNLLGISDKVDAMRGRGSEAQANALSVRLELQADCFAGVWAHSARRRSRAALEPGDIETALNAAAADRRRHPAAQVAGHGRARELHARHQRAARQLVQARRRERQRRSLQHLRRPQRRLAALRASRGRQRSSAALQSQRSTPLRCRRRRSAT